MIKPLTKLALRLIPFMEEDQKLCDSDRALVFRIWQDDIEKETGYIPDEIEITLERLKTLTNYDNIVRSRALIQNDHCLCLPSYSVAVKRQWIKNHIVEELRDHKGENICRCRFCKRFFISETRSSYKCPICSRSNPKQPELFS